MRVFLVAALVVLAARTAVAETRTIQGTVVRFDVPAEMVIDVGTTQGVSNGDVLELWRPYHVKHPVTGKQLEDRFRIGSVRVTQARPSLSLAAPEGATAHGVQAGDLVLIQRDVPLPTPQPALVQPGVKTQPPPDTLEPKDDDARDLAKLFEALAGTSPADRARRYISYANEHPNSRFVPVLRQEAADLQRPTRKSEGRRATTDADGPSVVSFDPITDVYANEPLRVTIELEKARGAVLYARNAERLTYVPLKMQEMNNGYFAGTIPAEEVHSAKLDYFVEAINDTGAAVAVKGTPADPMVASVVDRPVAAPPKPVRVQAAIWSDFAAFNAKKLNDWASQTEGVLGVRFQDTGIRAMRTGFGIYRGQGGTLDELDKQQLEPRSIGLTYGYLEGEYAFHTLFSIILRGVIGLREPGIDGGGHVFFRIGNDLKTNLALGFEFLGGIGIRGIAQLEWNTIPRVPIVFRSEVTNQPAGIAANSPMANMAFAAGDIGVRLIVQAGFRITPAFLVSLRGSFQGRTIDHAGPGGGAALSYQW